MGPAPVAPRGAVPGAPTAAPGAGPGALGKGGVECRGLKAFGFDTCGTKAEEEAQNARRVTAWIFMVAFYLIAAVTDCGQIVGCECPLNCGRIDVLKCVRKPDQKRSVWLRCETYVGCEPAAKITNEARAER
mmetsp:Transcript_44135/g.134402  ORF Transcript_44135/g.134402 Transcript_44135/m.134402 type:complete len:132 (-) Transcript_44135:75-470(-)